MCMINSKFLLFKHVSVQLVVVLSRLHAKDDKINIKKNRTNTKSYVDKKIKNLLN